MKENNYCIKNGYIARKEFVHFDDTSFKDEFQDDVYKHAHKIFEENKNNDDLNQIIDIGCGSAYKLLKYFQGNKILGVENEPTLSWLQQNKREPFVVLWLSSEEAEKYFHYKLFSNEYRIILCSDVIEHVLEPDDLLNFINSFEFDHLILSTPERDTIQRMQRGYTWNGPPNNICHVREWTFDEFEKYVGQFFNIQEHFIAPNQRECQIVV